MIQFEHVSKSYGKTPVLKDLNFTIPDGQFVVLIGPSGCGKTTTMKMINRLLEPDSGTIRIDGQDIHSQDKVELRRHIGYVIQQIGLFPNMTVAQNICVVPKLLKYDKARCDEIVQEMLQLVHMEQSANKYPSELSGGQQQRIALARAIVVNPKVMLLDEPLSNLDPQLRETMRFEIKKLQKEFGFTIIFVTHDQSEAMALSDRMLVMDMGNIQQTGTPLELYNNPKNRFVHSFLGQSNFTHVKIKGGKAYCQGDSSRVVWEAPAGTKDGEMLMATRPNTIDINRSEGFCTKIIKRVFRTDFVEYLVQVGDDVLRVQTPHRNLFSEGEECFLRFPSPMWYPAQEEGADEERAKRMIV